MAGHDSVERFPAPAGENKSVAAREIPFSLIWLNAVDPRIFTPITLQRGGMTQIRLQSPDDSTRIRVYRTIGHNIPSVDINDEIDAGEDGCVSRFNYEIGHGPDAKLIKYGRSPTLSDHMQRIVRSLSGLVGIQGASIRAVSREFGEEASFVSDGTQWVSERTGQAPASFQELTAAEPPVLQ